MKAKNVALISCVVLLSIATSLCAESESSDARPFMGVLLDTSPLPDLLIKHLGLSSDQGIRITNVHLHSPADKAGLERDDIIIGFEGKKVKNSESQKFIDEVRNASVGTEVSLEIIHLGKRKAVKLELKPFEDGFEWKYPSEPEIVQSWRPGKMFRLKPGDKDWMEIELPFHEKSLEVYAYHHSDDGEEYTITIEGDPDDEDTKITVQIGDEEYKTTVGDMKKLPKKYRDYARGALEDSRKYSRQSKQTRIRKFSLPPALRPDELLSRFKDSKRFHVTPEVLPFGSDDRMFDKIEKQMRKLQERIEELEKRLRKIPERFSDEPDKEKSKEQEKPVQPEKKDQQRV